MAARTGWMIPGARLDGSCSAALPPAAKDRGQRVGTASYCVLVSDIPVMQGLDVRWTSQALRETLDHPKLISFHARMWRWAELLAHLKQSDPCRVHRVVSKHEDRAGWVVRRGQWHALRRPAAPGG
jgi:hypothetical protein